MLYCSASWRLENAKSPAATCSRKTAHRRHTQEYTAYGKYLVTCWLYLRSLYIYLVQVCLEACDYRAFVAINRMTNRHGH